MWVVGALSCESVDRVMDIHSGDGTGVRVGTYWRTWWNRSWNESSKMARCTRSRTFLYVWYAARRFSPSNITAMRSPAGAECTSLGISTEPSPTT